MKKVNFVTSTLPLSHGGRTKSLLQRARIFTNNSISVKIYTTNFNQDYDLVYKSYRKRKLVNSNIEMCNIYDYYKLDNSSKKGNYKTFLANELGKYNPSLSAKEGSAKEGFLGKLLGGKSSVSSSFDGHELKKTPTSDVTYYYKDGRPVYHISRHEGKNKIKNIDLYLPYYSRSIVRAYTDRNEDIYKVRYFQSGTDLVMSDVFVDAGLNPYVIKEYSYVNQEQKLDRVILLRKDGTNHVFKTEKDFFGFWFNEIFSDGDIVINDARLLDKPLLENEKNIKRIFQLHNSHLADPANESSKTKGSFKLLLESNLKDTDIIVALTDGQRQNILKSYPHLSKNIAVIPHSAKLLENKYPVIDKQMCIVARLAPQKNLQDSIEAFYQFNEQVKGYTLVIYGDGEEKESLMKMVKEKNLESMVKFMGATNDPDKVFQESILSLLSSHYEGFGLTVLESVVNGCPVVSYDVMWGPSEIIDENSGRISKSNTPESLCQEMLEEIRNPKDRNDVRRSAEKFSVESFYNGWNKLINA